MSFYLLAMLVQYGLFDVFFIETRECVHCSRPRTSDKSADLVSRMVKNIKIAHSPAICLGRWSDRREYGKSGWTRNKTVIIQNGKSRKEQNPVGLLRWYYVFTIILRQLVENRGYGWIRMRAKAKRRGRGREWGKRKNSKSLAFRDRGRGRR